jgi:hypothetical protein
MVKQTKKTRAETEQNFGRGGAFGRAGGKMTASKKGRPSELTSALQAHLCELLESAVPILVACSSAGIAASTYHSWRARGASGEQPFADFLAATSRARQRAKIALLTVIQEAAPTDWRAASWLLQKMIPAHQWQEESPPPPVVTIEPLPPLPDDQLAKLLAEMKAEDQKNDAMLAEYVEKLKREAGVR